MPHSTKEHNFQAYKKKNLFYPYIHTFWSKWCIRANGITQILQSERGPAHKKWCHTQAFVMEKVLQMETDSGQCGPLYNLLLLTFPFNMQKIFSRPSPYPSPSPYFQEHLDSASNELVLTSHKYMVLGSDLSQTWVWVCSCPDSSTTTLLFILFIKCKFDGLQQVNFFYKSVT